MESLHWINGQITRTQNSLYMLHLQLDEKRRDLERLVLAQANLQENQEKLKQYKTQCTKPDLTENTWAGHLADQYEQWKELTLFRSYIDLYDYQLTQTLEQLNDKIKETKQSIIDIRMDLSTQSHILDDLYGKQRRELLN
ncbi:hypothetical protein CAI16_07120 [Virgibacillus dokdonensis]|uniref:DUF5082 domain-containing protein n=2 Tax=Virgibacillus TaxID=84406 RepID=A0A1M5USL3_9BACI|nr:MULTISPECIES: DUF5082 family protein [Virgibacillus]RFA35818.1 hypothetical protein CAI16_07120 [Virgibacillus dokdonensis]SHH65924.1 protein of unknown function [Virgibacillus chiguensis]